MRHAYAQHNQLKDKVKNKHGKNKKFKDLSQGKALRTQKQLIDCSITEVGKKQAKQATQIINFQSIGLILTSPLKRCLQTCDQIINNLQNPPQVIVTPLLTDRVSSSWAIHSNFQDSQKLFPKFNFQQRQSYSHAYINFDKKYWQEQNQQKMKTLHLIKQGFSQTYLQFHNRVQQFRAKLRIYKQMANGKHILIITHSSFLKFLTGTGTYNKQKKSLDGLKFEHCSPLFFKNQVIENGGQRIYYKQDCCDQKNAKKTVLGQSNNLLTNVQAKM